MKTFIYLFVFSLLATSCAGHKNLAQANAAAASVTADGSSFDKAIFIKEDRRDAIFCVSDPNNCNLGKR